MHDAVARRDFEPGLPPVPDHVLEDEEDSVKIVSLVKTKEPLVGERVIYSSVGSLRRFWKRRRRRLLEVKENIDTTFKECDQSSYLSAGERANNHNRLPGALLRKRDLKARFLLLPDADAVRVFPNHRQRRANPEPRAAPGSVPSDPVGRDCLCCQGVAQSRPGSPPSPDLRLRLYLSVRLHVSTPPSPDLPSLFNVGPL